MRGDKGRGSRKKGFKVGEDSTGEGFPVTKAEQSHLGTHLCFCSVTPTGDPGETAAKSKEVSCPVLLLLLAGSS